MKITLMFALLFMTSNFAFADSSKLEIRALADAPLIQASDCAHAAVTGSGDQSLLMVQIKKEAASRLKAYSMTHIDSPLAIIVDGRLVAAPRIRVALGDRFQAGPLDQAEATRIAALINNQAPSAE